MSSSKQILPGSWLGVFGGGQLGRMFVHSAQRLGYHVAVLDPEVNCPAAQAADRHFCPTEEELQSGEVIEEFAKACSAITLEFENVSADWVRIAERTTPVRPSAEFLAICQDRIREKSSVRDAGFPVTPFEPVKSEQDIHSAAERLGWPLIVKTTRSGYDGKGQVVIRSASEVSSQWAKLSTDDAIAEQRIEFQAEVSMLVARSPAGQVVTYPLVENTHANHILDVSRCPVSSHLLHLEPRAREIVSGIASAYKVEGLFCAEFFVDSRGELMINELAPRPHNSGHLTIEGFATSQFEQQVRAMCNLPLGATDGYRPSAMANLLGDLWYKPSGTFENADQGVAFLENSRELSWEKALAAPATHVHLYGKAEARPGRKMGHLTCVADSAEEAVARVRALRSAL